MKYIKSFFREFIVVVIAFTVSDYCSANIFHSEKWYLELGVFVIMCLVLRLIPILVKAFVGAEEIEYEYESVEEFPEELVVEIKRMKSEDIAKAVKCVREKSGADLLAAKQYVDKL